jgi:hypothetical protein
MLKVFELTDAFVEEALETAALVEEAAETVARLEFATVAAEARRAVVRITAAGRTPPNITGEALETVPGLPSGVLVALLS